MESQLKRGFLEVVVLASLKYQDSYGYMIAQEVANVVDISESTLYPILRRLETQGYVTTYETTHNTRIRRNYQITKAGLKKLEESDEDYRDMKKIFDYILR